MTAYLNTTPFQSFWWGGYECTDQLNAFGNRVDFLPLTGHLQMLDKDYTFPSVESLIQVSSRTQLLCKKYFNQY